MGKPIYPLEQILDVKRRRVEEAERVVKEKKETLEKEQKKLEEREADRDKAKKHQTDKLQQLRETLDQGSYSPKIQQMKNYLKIVDEKLKIEEKKVADQKEVVKQAEKNLETARKELQIKRVEVDKINIHKSDWEKQMKRELEIQEGREQDELGAMIHSSMHKKNLND